MSRLPDKAPSLSKDHHYAVAHVAARAAHLDYMIEIAIYALCSPDRHTPKFLLKNLGRERLIALLEALLFDRFENRKIEINDLIRRLNAARKERNELFQWMWGRGDERGPRGAGMQGPYRPDYKDKTPAEIRDVAVRMVEVIDQLNVLVEEHFAAEHARSDLLDSFLDKHAQAPRSRR